MYACYFILLFYLKNKLDVRIKTMFQTQDLRYFAQFSVFLKVLLLKRYRIFNTFPK